MMHGTKNIKKMKRTV